MNHNPSDNSVNVPLSGRAVVAGGASVQENPDRAYLLNPSLQQALNCLDIKLEDELNRFRAKQEDGLNDKITPKQDIHTGDTPPIAVTWEQHPVDFDLDPEILTAEIIQPELSRTTRADDPPRQNQNLPSSQPEVAPIGGFVIIDGLTTTTSNSRSAIPNINYAPIALRRENTLTSQESLDLHFSSGGEIATFQDEYSSSSQELLRQIQSGYPSADTVNNPAQSAVAPPKRKLLTPVKIGSMAAACVLAGGAVYTYLNPSVLAPLTATKVVMPTTTTNSLGQMIQSPNLAANEFTELNLSSLTTVEVPATATTVNATRAGTATVNATQPGVSTAPVAIPFTGQTKIIPPITITSQPRLADSLVRSLLPPNFHSLAKPSVYRSAPAGIGR